MLLYRVVAFEADGLSNGMISMNVAVEPFTFLIRALVFDMVIERACAPVYRCPRSCLYIDLHPAYYHSVGRSWCANVWLHHRSLGRVHHGLADHAFIPECCWNSPPFCQSTKIERVPRRKQALNPRGLTFGSNGSRLNPEGCNGIL